MAKFSRQSRSVALAGLLVSVFPVTSHALGLGGIKVHSALNEPLNAEIEFTSVTDKELKGLNASLATRVEFDSAGVERLPYLSTIKFSVGRKLDGRHILQLNTEQQIDEPFLHLLLQVEWPGGRLVREYAALIDPPQQIPAKPSGIEPPVAAPAGKTPSIPATGAATGVIAPLDAASAAEPLPETKSTTAPVAETPPPADAAIATQPKADEGLIAAAPPPVPADTAATTPDGAAVQEAPSDTLLGPGVVVDKDRDALGPTEQPLENGAPSVAPLPPPVTTAEPSAPDTGAVAPRVASTSEISWAKVNEYTVRPGDTLWRIVEDVRTDRQITTEQAILAVYKANRDAFFGNNVNNLRAGKILKIPEREQVSEVTASQARKEFRAQYDVWQEYKLKLASAGSALKVPDEAEAAPAETKPAPAPATVKETAPAKPKEEAAANKPEKPAAAAKSPDEMLKIVRSNLKDDKQKGTPEKKVAETESAKEAKERQALAERVTTLEESLVSRQIEAKDLADKIGQVRTQLKNESRLIELESQALAKAAKKETPPAADTKKVAPEPPAKAEPPKAEAPKETPKAEAPRTEVAKVEAAKPKPEAAKPKPAPAKKAATAPPVEEKGFIDSLLEDILGSDFLPFVLGGFLLVSGAIAFLYLRRRKKSIAEFEESILSADSIGTEGAVSTTTDTAGQVVSAGDTSFLSDFSQGGMGNIHTDEVDPVAEAEVYLAYGRDETAEEILKDAVVKNPDRQELKIKLLDIYHQRNDVQAFETLAEELYAALGGRRDKNWERVEEMGRKLNPANPMFSGGAPAGGKAAASKSFADTHRGSQASVPIAAAAPAGAAHGEAEDSINLDFSGIGESKPKEAESVALDFDLGGGLDLDAAGSKDEPASIDFNATIKTNVADLGGAHKDEGLASLDLGADESAASSDSGMIDFSVGLDSEPAAAEPAAPSAAGGGLDFDLDLAGADMGTESAVVEAPAGIPVEGSPAPGQWDETATKLDLAKAYIDMGDAEGARSILDEVMAEGSEAQKSQAKELAAQLH
jgi:pilus assembly protein FimV